MELVEFLLQRIAEDEAAVTAILRRAPHWSVDHEPWAQGVGVVDSCRESIAVAVGDYAAFHIARWDPARVLAECEAKRRIVDRSHILSRHGTGRVLAPDMRWVLASLALPYAAHPDYREEWRP